MNPIETHEKNLAWIEGEIKSISEQFISDEGYTNSLRANRKTLERHGPENVVDWNQNTTPMERDDYPQCRECQDGVFPCTTYTDITEGLGIPQ